MRKLPVLLHTVFPRDAEMTSAVLEKAGFECVRVEKIDEVCASVLTAGAIIVSDEVLTKEITAQLRGALGTQPVWSDVPIILVTASGTAVAGSSERLERLIESLTNVTILERPIRLATLITVVRGALSSREKQFELKALLGEIESSKAAAESANAAKTSFLANMSHEIRTPLAAIIGFTELMKDTTLPSEERLQFAEIVARNGDQLSGLINDILDLSKIEAGKLEIEKMQISLPNFIAEVTSLLRPLVIRKGLKFSVGILSPLPDLVISDATRIRQILLNLVSNAAKFTPKGGVRVEIKSRDLPNGPHEITFTVRDTGIGMTEIQKQKLFSPFTQADSSTTRVFGGTGLGLALSKRLAVAMGGDLVVVDSRPGEGSQFDATILVERVEVRPALGKTPSEASMSLSNMEVLLVEDSPDNQLLMRRYLTAAGAKVVTADNGRDAFELAMANHFDVVLMDVQMPVMDGLTATRKLRSEGYSQPVLALTAHALGEERDRSLQYGCNEHLSKPIDRQMLIEVLSKYRSTGRRSS